MRKRRSPMVKNKALVRIRWALRIDLLQMLDIERDSFRNPWTEDDFVKILQQHKCVAMVAEVHDRIVGYVVYELNKKSIYLHNLAVATKGVGIGRELLSRLEKKIRLPSLVNRTYIECHVRETNLDACKFFRALGWRAIKIVPGFYEADDGGCDEDAYLFRWTENSKAMCDD